MSAFSREALWQRLCEAGLAEGAVPDPSAATSPWYVRTMLGVAGWIGALFLLGFVGAAMAFVFRSEAAGLVVGTACCAAAFMIFRIAGRNDLASQFGLAVSLAGQVMFATGLFGLANSTDSPSPYLGMAVFEAVLAVLLANFVHRVWATLASMMALGLALNILGPPGVATGVVAIAFAVLWLAETEWAANNALWRPIGFGLAFALLHFDGLRIAGAGWLHRGSIPPLWTFWIGPIVVAVVLIYAVSQLIDRQGAALTSRTGVAALTATAAVALATLYAPGVAGSLLILLIGFAGGNRTLHGVGVLGMLGYISYFYYALNTTLLVKSAALGGTGVVLILLWAGTRLMFGDAPAKEATHA